jgi:sialate O-acetylesterase
MQQRRHTLLMTILLVALCCCSAQADVRLPDIFGDHMVLQREQPIAVWGWADAGENVTVTLGETEAAATANDDGEWLVRLAPQTAGGPHSLSVTGANKITFSDVLIGEVWLCSGQSNMEWTVNSSDQPEVERANAKYSQIRHIKIPKRPAGYPQQDVEAQWTVCSPETVGSYTAVGYFFGRYLHQQLDVPIGLINSSWGGTRIEPWTPPVGFAEVPKLADILRQVQLTDPTGAAYQQKLRAYLQSLEDWSATARTALESETPLQPAPAYPEELKPLTSHQSPSTLYNGMIHPLVPYGIRGAIWYQGESNHSEGLLYYEKMKALIAGWRNIWSDARMPFYYVQIAPYQYGTELPNVLPIFWEAQSKALEIPHTGMAVIHDIGNLQDIHPKNKQDVGRRLALIALARTYGRQDVVYSGPTFKALKMEGNRLRVVFDHVGSGLVSRDNKPLNWFEIIGEETDFTEADATIDGDSVVLSAPEVSKPVAVRFAWHKLAEPNLANREGLPAVPFRAGEVPQRDWLALNVEEAKEFQLLYDLDLTNLGPEITYDVDNSAEIDGQLDRVAYFLELQKPGQNVSYVYAAMDAFCQDSTQLGIPTVSSGAKFQQQVKNLTVVSNVDGVVTGVNMPQGNIEFWPHNYGPANSARVPNASDSVWDFGDEIGPPENGHGCMQIHNYGARQTVLAINNWRSGGDANIGIGNSSGRTRDWTFISNASSYEVKRLRVLVRTE